MIGAAFTETGTVGDGLNLTRGDEDRRSARGMSSLVQNNQRRCHEHRARCEPVHKITYNTKSNRRGRREIKSVLTQRGAT